MERKLTLTGESSVSELAMNPDYFGGRSLARGSTPESQIFPA
ncbi:TPA: hypothetical protein ACV8ZB_004159 [Salmonella enterica]